MENIKELVALSQQLSAVIDDIGVLKVSGVSVDFDGRAKLLVSPEMFFESFKGFKIEVLENRRFKFRLSKVIQGVEFTTMVNDLSGLKIIKLVERNGISKGHKKSLRALACG